MKSKVQSVLLSIIGLATIVLVVGILTFALFHHVYSDQYPMLFIVNYAFDFNRSIFVWIPTLLVAYLVVTTYWDKLLDAFTVWNDSDFSKLLTRARNVLLAVVVGLLISGALILFLSVLLWNYVGSFWSYVAIHSTEETIERVANNIVEAGIGVTIGAWGLVLVSVLGSYVLISGKRKK